MIAVWRSEKIEGGGGGGFITGDLMGEDFLQQIEFVKDLKSVTSFKKIMFFLGVTTFHMYLRT